MANRTNLLPERWQAVLMFAFLTGGCAALAEPLTQRGQFWHKHGGTPEQIAAERGPGYPDAWAISVQRRDFTPAEITALDASIDRGIVRPPAQDLSRVERALQSGQRGTDAF